MHADHFEAALNGGRRACPEALSSIARPPNLAPAPQPTLEQVARAVRRLKAWRAADAQQLSAELLKAAGPLGLQWLHRVVELARTEGAPSVATAALLPLR